MKEGELGALVINCCNTVCPLNSCGSFIIFLIFLSPTRRSSCRMTGWLGCRGNCTTLSTVLWLLGPPFHLNLSCLSCWHFLFFFSFYSFLNILTSLLYWFKFFCIFCRKLSIAYSQFSPILYYKMYISFKPCRPPKEKQINSAYYMWYSIYYM